MATPKFLQGKGDFHIELKRRVNQYFTDHKRPMTGNNALLFKAILFCMGYILLYIEYWEKTKNGQSQLEKDQIWLVSK